MVIGIRGRRGTGKSNFAVYLAKLDKDAGRKIISTMESLTFKDKYMTLGEIVREWETLKNCTVLIDEIQLVADNRRALSNKNIRMNQFFTQLRKRNIVVIFTTQFFQDIDPRIRRQVDTIYHMENIYEYGKKSKQLFRYDLFIRDGEIAEHIRSSEFDGKKFQSLYDTDEIQTYDTEDEDE